MSDKDYVAHVEKYHVSQSMKEAEEKWNIFSAAQNLSAVLNDPSRGRQSNLFTKKWGDSFVERSQFTPSQHLPRVDWNHLELYCRKIGKRYRRHVRLGHAGNVNSDNVAPTPSISPSSSISSLQISANNHESSQYYKQIFNEKLLNNATIRDIPQIFVKQSLDISRQETFSLVFEDIDINSNDQHQNLQDSLSHYLDIVEIQIAKQVSQKSSSFFHAMTSQDTIMDEMSKAVSNVRKIRDKLRQIDETLVHQSLNIISCERIKTNKIFVLEKLKLMATVHQTQPMIQILLASSDFVAAVDLISTTQEILTQELNGISCFRHLPQQLKELEKLIDKMLASDFERYATSDLNRPLLEEDDRVLDEEKIVSIISGLLRKRNFSFIGSYKNECVTTIRAVIKQHVIEMIASSDEEICLRGDGEDAQSFTLNNWIILLEATTVDLLKLLKRMRLIHDLMLDVANVNAGEGNSQNGCSSFVSDGETFLCSEDHEYVKNKLKDFLISVTNYCHERCANLVANQKIEQYSGSMEEIERLNNVIEKFCSACVEVTGVGASSLMMALKNQGTKFGVKFHNERKSKLSSLLDSERWKSTEVPCEFQQIVNHISEGNFTPPTTDENNVSSATSMLIVDDKEPFALVSVCYQLFIIALEYCQCAENLPMMAIQMERNVIDLVRSFNSRTCQLILGAGAVHTAGLKMITINNLALCSRALQLVLWLIPNLKNHFRKLETNNTTWPAVEKDVVSHVKEIESKMVTVVQVLVNNQLDAWEAKPPIPSQSFRNISRNFVKLHEAIAQVLPIEQIYGLFRIVHRNFKEKLREQLVKLNIINNGTPRVGYVSMELIFYLETLRTLKALPSDELKDDVIDDVWIK